MSLLILKILFFPFFLIKIFIAKKVIKEDFVAKANDSVKNVLESWK